MAEEEQGEPVQEHEPPPMPSNNVSAHCGHKTPGGGRVDSEWGAPPGGQRRWGGGVGVGLSYRVKRSRGVGWSLRPGPCWGQQSPGHDTWERRSGGHAGEEGQRPRGMAGSLLASREGRERSGGHAGEEGRGRPRRTAGSLLARRGGRAEAGPPISAQTAGFRQGSWVAVRVEAGR